MKKILIPIMLFVLISGTCSCSHQYSVDGYENFQTSHSHYELNVCLLPTSDFTEIFPYTEINYYYREKYKSLLDFTELSFLIVKYEKKAYEQAKEYCFQNMQLSNLKIQYNEYVFIENAELAGQDLDGTANSFPKWTNMFCYNDNLNCLIFIGFFNSIVASNNAKNTCDNWASFLEKYFGEFYTFD